MLSAFACKEIEDGEYWLVDDLDIRCWHGSHTDYALFIAFPGFVIYGLVAPLLVAIPIVKNRKQLKTNPDIKRRFGFLILGYTDKTYWWEFAILYRKISIVIISVFFAPVSTAIQGHLAFTVLII